MVDYAANKAEEALELDKVRAIGSARWCGLTPKHSRPLTALTVFSYFDVQKQAALFIVHYAGADDG